MRSTAGHQPTPKQASAHVCTANTAPAIQDNDTWLHSAAEARHSSEILLKQYYRLKAVRLARATWDGHWALFRDAEHSESFAIEGGALLHIGVPAAIQQAMASLKSRGVLA
ncbi:hypothetical protein [Comamonas sp.]|uniref:hypothetical protein n=1 Tax=Comamonas sp. TaxID=34028 RepID=UPI003D13F984